MGDARFDAVGRMVLVDLDALTAALRRAHAVLSELNYSRRSEDIERARSGAEHEVETALALLGQPWQRVGERLPGPVPEEGPPDELPFA